MNEKESNIPTAMATPIDDSASKSKYEYAESYFMGFLATTNLYGLLDKVGVLFVGLCRVGKSSAVAVQRGSTLHPDDTSDGSRVYTPANGKGGPKVSHSVVAKTVGVSPYHDWQNKRMIFDTPGLNDNRAEAYKVWSKFCLDACYTLLGGVDATCVVIHYSIAFGGGATVDSFRDLAQTLLASSGKGKKRNSFMKNLCFLMTHVPEPATLPGIINKIQQVYLAELSEQNNLLTDLARRFPNREDVTVSEVISSVQAAICTGQVGKQRAEAKMLRGKINPDHPNLQVDPGWHDLERVVASIQLIETILASEDRIVLGRPNGNTGCRNQRHSLETVFGLCQQLNQEKLKEIAQCRQLPNYEIYEIFLYLARKLTTKLQNFNDCMFEFLTSAREQEDTVRAINENWKAFRDALVIDLGRKQDAKERVKKDLQAEVKKMRESETLMASPGDIYPVTKIQDEWFGWLWYTRTSVSHTGPYVQVDVSGRIVDKDIIVDESNPESVRVVLQSVSRGGNIDATVKFLQRECDLEETKQKIREKEKKILKYEKEVDKIIENLRSLQAVSSADRLTCVVVENETASQIQDLQAADDALYAQVPTNITDGDKPGAADLKVHVLSACEGLKRLFNALSLSGAVPSPIADSTTFSWDETVEHFQKSYDLFKTRASEYKNFQAAVMLTSAAAANVVQDATILEVKLDTVEDDSKVGVAHKAAAMANTSVTSAKNTVAKHVGNNPLVTLASVGVALLTVKYNLCITLGVLFIVAASLLGLNSVVYEVRRGVRVKLEHMKDEVKHLLYLLETHGSTKIEETGKAILSEISERRKRAEDRLKLSCYLTTAIEILSKVFNSAHTPKLPA